MEMTGEPTEVTVILLCWLAVGTLALTKLMMDVVVRLLKRSFSVKMTKMKEKDKGVEGGG